MIIAILEDTKGFRKAIQLPYRLNEISIPKKPLTSDILLIGKTDEVDDIKQKAERIIFYLYKELEAAIFLYKERK